MFSLIAAAAMSVALPPTRLASDEFVVHEWGTFTSFAGPDGTPREFQTSIGAKLPKFVYSRALLAGNKDDHDLDRVKFMHDTLVRMETPVTYFYTDVARTVDVDVRMSDGSLTEFYPPVTRMEPEYRGLNKEVASGGRLVWTGVQLVPAKQGESVQVPPVMGDDHYGAAHEVDAAFVRFDAPKYGGVHNERFLFYRGIGNFDPPVIAKSLGGDRFTVTNRQAEDVAAVFVVDVEGGRLRFASYGKCDKELDARLPDESASVDSLAAAMQGALIESGLFAKEAAAMVKTWRSSWFAEEGTRVMYILPQAVTDRIVPLSVTPAPESQVRVFVGRAEVFTPEAQARVEVELAKIANPAQGWGTPVIVKLGRFAKPVVECIASKAGNAEAGRVARGMLGK